MNGKYLIKAYNELGEEVGCGYANDEADKENAKIWLKGLETQTGLKLQLEIIKNPDEEDIKDLTDKLTSMAEGVKSIKNSQALEEICELYDSNTITVTEAINRINALYEDEGERDNAIHYLMSNRNEDYDEDGHRYYDDEEDEEDCDCDDNCEHCPIN